MPEKTKIMTPVKLKPNKNDVIINKYVIVVAIILLVIENSRSWLILFSSRQKNLTLHYTAAPKSPSG